MEHALQKKWLKMLNNTENILIKENQKSVLLFDNFEAEKTIKINVESNASLELLFLNLKEMKNTSVELELSERSSCQVYLADFSYGFGQFNFVATLKGNDSSIYFDLASLTSKSDSKVFNINFNHIGKRTHGMMNNYGVTKDESKLQFLGVCFIQNGSSETETHQNAKIIVFDDMCVAKANPILKIDENNVQASHSSIVGTLNDDHIYYLNSRGINKADAKRLITYGYLKPIAKHFKVDIQEQIIKTIDERIN